MAGVPVRLSEQLTERAKKVAAMQDRSLTEQVEHWARLGQLVEESVSAATVLRLKALSYDVKLPERLARVRTPEGRASVAAFIAERDPVRHGEERGKPVTVSSKKKR